VFSQFTSFLDLIQAVLKRERFEQYRFDGSMDMKKRGMALDEFRAPTRRPKVLIVSLKAGGVGLNVSLLRRCLADNSETLPVNDCQSCLHGLCFSISLVVVIDRRQMDCWWNAATENQGNIFLVGPSSTDVVS
jgi:hypothetical protein